jgi:hypothetical protein
MSQKRRIEPLIEKRRGAMLKKLKNYEVGNAVFYKGKKHSIISIYSEQSPLCGYVLLSKIGSPVLASAFTKTKN